MHDVNRNVQAFGLGETVSRLMKKEFLKRLRGETRGQEDPEIRMHGGLFAVGVFLVLAIDFIGPIPSRDLLPALLKELLGAVFEELLVNAAIVADRETWVSVR